MSEDDSTAGEDTSEVCYHNLALRRLLRLLIDLLGHATLPKSSHSISQRLRLPGRLRQDNGEDAACACEGVREGVEGESASFTV